jgi:hypothetical protein
MLMVILFKKKYEMHFQVLTNDVSRDAWGQYFCLSCNRKKFKNSILKKQKWNYDVPNSLSHPCPMNQIEAPEQIIHKHHNHQIVLFEESEI